MRALTDVIVITRELALKAATDNEQPLERALREAGEWEEPPVVVYQNGKAGIIGTLETGMAFGSEMIVWRFGADIQMVVQTWNDLKMKTFQPYAVQTIYIDDERWLKRTAYAGTEKDPEQRSMFNASF